MPSKTFVIGFVSGVAFAFVMIILLFGVFSSQYNPTPQPLSSALYAATNPAQGKLIETSNLDSREGLSEVEKMRYALEKIISELDTIGDQIYNLKRPIEKIADKMD